VSNKTGRGAPPADTRFKKGQSGNPKGRPRRVAPEQVSAFDIVIEKTLTVTQGGLARELTVEEALQHKTYQEAISGSKPARREVLKMIARREKALAARQPPQPAPVERLIEAEDPRNADEALLILGIACEALSGPRVSSELFLKLEPWAVQAALKRRRGAKLDQRDVASIERCTRDPGSLVWPRGTASGR
jgi:hypothetical protein